MGTELLSFSLLLSSPPLPLFFKDEVVGPRNSFWKSIITAKHAFSPPFLSQNHSLGQFIGKTRADRTFFLPLVLTNTSCGPFSLSLRRRWEQKGASDPVFLSRSFGRRTPGSAGGFFSLSFFFTTHIPAEITNER